MPLDGTGFWETTTERDLRVLRHARAGIARPGGWCQRQMHYDGAWCAAGWVSLAVPGGRDDVNRRMRLLRQALPWWRRLFSSDHAATFAVVRYNDRPACRQRDMVALFDRAIRRLEVSLLVQAE